MNPPPGAQKPTLDGIMFTGGDDVSDVATKAEHSVDSNTVDGSCVVASDRPIGMITAMWALVDAARR